MADNTTHLMKTKESIMVGTASAPEQFLETAEGRVAFEVSGTGPLIVAVPGMGDLRSTWRFVSAELVAAGFRVALTDLRGHGGSDATFSSYGDAETAADATALIEHLGGPAIVVGNSMAAGSAVLVAASTPELVSGLALVGPFVRNPPVSAVARVSMRILMARPWAAAVWAGYLPSLYAGRKPADFEEYRALVRGAMKRPGRAAAFSATTRTSHEESSKRIGEVSTPTLVVMGALDPDFADPAAEARWIGEQLDGEVLLVDEAGHYPQSQRPDVVGPALVAFAQQVSRGAARG
jgi:pimeloyl-ACP methyl ester carboxylesterase